MTCDDTGTASNCYCNRELPTWNNLNFPSQYNSRIQWLLVLGSSFKSFSALVSLYDFKESKTDRLTFLMDTEFISRSFH